MFDVPALGLKTGSGTLPLADMSTSFDSVNATTATTAVSKPSLGAPPVLVAAKSTNAFGWHNSVCVAGD